jgi:rubrerythrin
MGLLSRLLGTADGRRDLMEDLIEAYRAEAEHAARLRHHAEHARYPQVAETLRELARAEDVHAELVRDRILALGGGVPPVAPLPPVAHNQWARAVAARQEAQQKRRRLVELIARWDPERPDEVAVLRRIEAEDTNHREAYERLVMRADPHALD